MDLTNDSSFGFVGLDKLIRKIHGIYIILMTSKSWNNRPMTSKSWNNIKIFMLDHGL